MINSKLKPFNATAFKQGEFVEISEKDVLGKWSVFFFYPADFTFVCPTEILSINNSISEFEDKNTKVLF